MKVMSCLGQHLGQLGWHVVVLGRGARWRMQLRFFFLFATPDLLLSHIITRLVCMVSTSHLCFAQLLEVGAEMVLGIGQTCNKSRHINTSHIDRLGA